MATDTDGYEGSISAGAYQGTGPGTDKGVPIIIAMIIAVLLLMAAVTQGHNSVNEGTDAPAGSYSSSVVTDGPGG